MNKISESIKMSNSQIERAILLTEFSNCFQLQGASTHDPVMRGFAPGPQWGHRPQTPTIGSRYHYSPLPPHITITTPLLWFRLIVPQPWELARKVQLSLIGSRQCAFHRAIDERILVEIVVLERGWVILSANFRWNGGSATNDCWRQKTRVPGLSCGVVCVILRLAVLIQYRRVRDTQTHRQTHDDG